MGVTDLWKLVSPTTQGQTLTEFAVGGLEGHVQDPGGVSMMAIGIDASAWLYAVCKLQAFQFGHAQSGENPELRTLTYKLVTLAKAPVHAHFVFDGEDRPSMKHGKHVRSAPHWLTRGLQELLQIFGFTWSTAKGEAEADLAFLSKVGKIHVVLTEDSDVLLFGAKKVLRVTDNNDGMFKVDIYHAQALSKDPHVPLTTSRLLLWAMLRGGDYNMGGLTGCGRQVSQALLKGNLSDLLMQVVTSATPAQLPGMLETWRNCLRTVLRDGTLGRKYPTLAASIPADFPSIDIIRLYLYPITSWSEAGEPPVLPRFLPTQPDLECLAKFCKTHLGWLPEKVHKYFRKSVWPAAFMRALCQLPTSDGSALLKPSFLINDHKIFEGDVSTYRLTVYAPSFIKATNCGLQTDGDSSISLKSHPGEESSPSEGKILIPARVMQITSPEDVMNFSDRNPHLSNHPTGSSMPPPDWHPWPSAQYAVVAAIVWPESANRGQGSRIETHSNSDDDLEREVASKGKGKELYDKKALEIIDLTAD
ncbi:PIN domain-like protein [Suillus occidentalis]|nr:PIN domain-like protein [Suillus occidentalis]